MKKSNSTSTLSEDSSFKIIPENKITENIHNTPSMDRYKFMQEVARLRNGNKNAGIEQNNI